MLVHVALAHEAARALFKVGGTPRAIEVVDGRQTVLHVRSCAHFRRAPDEHADFAFADLLEGVLLRLVGMRILDERDLLCGDAPFDQLVAQVLVNAIGGIERGELRLGENVGLLPVALALRGGHVAEHELRGLDGLALTVDAEHVFHATVHLAVLPIGKRRVDEPLIERDLAPVVGDFQHVVLFGRHGARMHQVSTLPEVLYVRLLLGRGLAGDRFVRRIGNVQVEHIGRLNVGERREEGHELRQVVKAREALLEAESRARGVDLD